MAAHLSTTLPSRFRAAPPTTTPPRLLPPSTTVSPSRPRGHRVWDGIAAVSEAQWNDTLVRRDYKTRYEEISREVNDSKTLESRKKRNRIVPRRDQSLENKTIVKKPAQIVYLSHNSFCSPRLPPTARNYSSNAMLYEKTPDSTSNLRYQSQGSIYEKKPVHDISPSNKKYQSQVSLYQKPSATDVLQTSNYRSQSQLCLDQNTSDSDVPRSSNKRYQSQISLYEKTSATEISNKSNRRYQSQVTLYENTPVDIPLSNKRYQSHASLYQKTPPANDVSSGCQNKYQSNVSLNDKDVSSGYQSSSRQTDSLENTSGRTAKLFQRSEKATTNIPSKWEIDNRTLLKEHKTLRLDDSAFERVSAAANCGSKSNQRASKANAAKSVESGFIRIGRGMELTCCDGCPDPMGPSSEMFRHLRNRIRLERHVDAAVSTACCRLVAARMCCPHGEVARVDEESFQRFRDREADTVRPKSKLVKLQTVAPQELQVVMLGIIEDCSDAIAASCNATRGQNCSRGKGNISHFASAVQTLNVYDCLLVFGGKRKLSFANSASFGSPKTSERAVINEPADIIKDDEFLENGTEEFCKSTTDDEREDCAEGICVEDNLSDIDYQSTSENSDSDGDWEYYDDEPQPAKAPVKPMFIPAGLLNRWQTLRDSDSEDESEEELDANSPYNSDPATSEAELKPWLAATIREWTEKMSTGPLMVEENQSFHDRNRLCRAAAEMEGENETGKNVKKKPEEDILEGLVTDIIDDNYGEKRRSEVFHCKGLKHGLYRTFSSAGPTTPQNEFKTLGTNFRGIKSGVEWTRREGNSFLIIAADDENNNGSGESEANGVYLYPDLIHAIEGTVAKRASN